MYKVLIDTSAYEEYIRHDGFKNEVFRVLKTLSDRKYIKVIVHDIIKQEVLTHICKNAVDLKSKSDKFFKDVIRKFPEKSSEHNDISDFYSKYKNFDLKTLRINECEDYFNSLCVEVINTQDVDVTSAVFERYFSKRPPFGQGKKSKEFPDAFITLSTVEKIKRDDLGVKLIFISADPDWKGFCDEFNIPLFKKLNEFTDWASSEEPEFSNDFKVYKRSNEIKGAIEKNESSLFGMIVEEIGTFEDYEPEDFFDVECYDDNDRSVSMQDIKVISSTESSAIVDINFEVIFSLNIHGYHINDTSFKDPDTKDRVYPYGKHSFKMTFVGNFYLESEVSYDENNIANTLQFEYIEPNYDLKDLDVGYNIDIEPHKHPHERNEEPDC
ncbi:MAG: PIN domain-containing protein [Pseudomonadota bacterium]|nr:PIN domain-containing protein [Pseudomonadota bacterium]